MTQHTSLTEKQKFWLEHVQDASGQASRCELMLKANGLSVRAFETELEALLLGIRMVGVWSDPALGRAAESAAGKIDAALPERLRPELERMALLVPPFGPEPEEDCSGIVNLAT
ncbi:MAG: hypothetical protein M0Q49_09815 [Porticoccaceae bacterium]|nr:hypothetical protein [Porticoccaceae bacterium]